MSESRKPLDHWLPPEGAGRPLACLATTFTFEAAFFEEQCLSRFLGLDWKRDEGGEEIAFLIELQEKFGEARISVLADRSVEAEGRSLQWDLLTVGVKGGVMHAKVTLLIWQNLVRLVVGSANLTRGSYRDNLEAQIVLDATGEDGPPSALMAELLVGLKDLAGRSRVLKRDQAFATIDDAERRLAAFGERIPRRRDPQMAIVPSGPGQSALDGLDAVWKGGPPRLATVLSPFFDADGADVAAAIGGRLAHRGGSEVKFVVKADLGAPGSKVRVHAPPSLLESLPKRVTGRMHSLRQTTQEELRGLHAKAILLESDSHTALLIGSSNFTRAGLGIGNPANHELNVAIGARKGTDVAKELSKLIPVGPPISLEDAGYLVEEEEDELGAQPELPWGFEEALLDPLAPASLRLRFKPEELPAKWSIRSHDDAPLADSVRWSTAGHPKECKFPLPSEALPDLLKVRWHGLEREEEAWWPVNVTDKAALPPPKALRDLSVDARLIALASSRPLHESVIEAMRATGGGGGNIELDPLLRYSQTGQLMRRARLASQAFAGLRTRLERPAANEEALVWRLEGPFGPKAIADGLVARAEDGDAVEGETSFLLAELALTLSHVDWSATGGLLPGGTKAAKKHARKALTDLRELRDQATEGEQLAGYVDNAFAEAKL